MNGILGTSFVSLPYAVKEAGWVAGVATLILAPIATAYTLRLSIRLAVCLLATLLKQQEPSRGPNKGPEDPMWSSTTDGVSVGSPSTQDVAALSHEDRLLEQLRDLSYPAFLQLVFGPAGFVIGSIFILLFDFGAVCVCYTLSAVICVASSASFFSIY
jgi:hypothetical protein